MQPITTQFFLDFSVYAIYVLACYFIGDFLRRLLVAEGVLSNIQKIFVCIVVGDAALISIYSIIKTKLLTINILIPVIFILAILLRKRPEPNDKVEMNSLPVNNRRLQRLITYCLILALPFLIKAVVFYNFEYHLPAIPQWDYQYYNTLSETINQNGHENFFGARALLFNSYNAPTPYHYHDIWLASLLLETHLLSSIGIYNLIVAGFTILLSLLGLLSIFELYKKVSVPILLGTALLLFVGSAYYHIGEFFIETYNPVEYQKLGISYGLIAASILFYKKGLVNNAILATCLLFIYNVTALSMIAGILFLLGLATIAKRKITKENIIYSVLPLTCILGFLAFYHYFGFKNLDIPFAFPTPRVFAYAVVNIFLKIFALFWVLYLWMILILLFNKQLLNKLRNERGFLIKSFYFICFCIFFQAVFVNLGDPTQFATCNATPILLISIFIVIIYFIVWADKKRTVNALMFFILVAFLIYSPYAITTSKVGIYDRVGRISKYSKEYISNVAAATKNIRNRIGVYWVDSSYFYNGNRMKEFLIRPGEYLKVMGNNFDLVCLSAFLMPDSKSKYQQSLKDQSALNLFKKKYNYLNLSPVDLERKFIKDYKIEYLIYINGAGLPAPIDSLIRNRYYDSKSGEVFCLL
jgi:hypothetical protein